MRLSLVILSASFLLTANFCQAVETGLVHSQVLGMQPGEITSERESAILRRWKRSDSPTIKSSLDFIFTSNEDWYRRKSLEIDRGITMFIRLEWQ
ncbi:unnamed protein product [Allacma fusca]|uniref:Uncharacterized protein n=1 Tax=Allacma fusca TaxID=39272 RepID=A0A8J2NIC2_9HEXA|nr:unnamed protein product [Allacma fusca]